VGVVCARLHVRVSCACYAAKLLQRFPHTTLACQAASDHIPHTGPQHSTLHMQHNTAELCSSSRCCCYIARGQLDKATKRAKQRFRQLVGHTHTLRPGYTYLNIICNTATQQQHWCLSFLHGIQPKPALPRCQSRQLEHPNHMNKAVKSASSENGWCTQPAT
jgi:hypothetical protein